MHGTHHRSVMAAVRLGDEVPDFVGESQHGLIQFHNFIEGRWAMVFTYAGDFDPVAATELGMVAKLQEEFDARNVSVIAIGIDTLRRHELWVRDVNMTQSLDKYDARDGSALKDARLRFPIIADATGAITETLGQMDPAVDMSGKRRAVSALFVIDPTKVVRMTQSYRRSVGRNFYEVLRVIDSLQRADIYLVQSPANWCANEQMLVAPEVTKTQATDLGMVVAAKLPYYRETPDPGIFDDR